VPLKSRGEKRSNMELDIIIKSISRHLRCCVL